MTQAFTADLSSALLVNLYGAGVGTGVGRGETVARGDPRAVAPLLHEHISHLVGGGVVVQHLDVVVARRLCRREGLDEACLARAAHREPRLEERPEARKVRLVEQNEHAAAEVEQVDLWRRVRARVRVRVRVRDRLRKGLRDHLEHPLEVGELLAAARVGALRVRALRLAALILRHAPEIVPHVPGSGVGSKGVGGMYPAACRRSRTTRTGSRRAAASSPAPHAAARLQGRARWGPASGG